MLFTVKCNETGKEYKSGYELAKDIFDIEPLDSKNYSFNILIDQEGAVHLICRTVKTDGIRRLPDEWIKFKKNGFFKVKWKS